MNYKDYYKILVVKKNGDSKRDLKPYRAGAAKYHPDKNPDNKAAGEKMSV